MKWNFSQIYLKSYLKALTVEAFERMETFPCELHKLSDRRLTLRDEEEPPADEEDLEIFAAAVAVAAPDPGVAPAAAVWPPPPPLDNDASSIPKVWIELGEVFSGIWELI